MSDSGLPPPGRDMTQHRQESVDSVGWDMSNQGMGTDAYRLPTIHPHTPLSGGFAQGGAGVNPQPNSNVVHAVTTSSPSQTPRQPQYIPPPGPPPQQLHPSATNPFASAENLTPGAGGSFNQPRPGPEAARTPPPLQPPPSTRQAPVQPIQATQFANVAPGPSSPYTSHPHSPVQYAIAYQPPSGPPSAANQPPLPLPQFSAGTGVTLTNPYDIQPGVSHMQDASDTSYYTAQHSRVGTEDELLTQSHPPTNYATPLSTSHPSSPHSPSIPYPPQRNFSPPPPSYRSM